MAVCVLCLIFFPGVFEGEQSQSAMEMWRALIGQPQNNLGSGAVWALGYSTA